MLVNHWGTLGFMGAEIGRRHFLTRWRGGKSEKGHGDRGRAVTGRFGAGSPAARLTMQAGPGKAAGWGGGDPPAADSQFSGVFWGSARATWPRSARQQRESGWASLMALESDPGGDGGEDVSGAVASRVSPPHPGL